MAEFLAEFLDLFHQNKNHEHICNKFHLASPISLWPAVPDSHKSCCSCHKKRNVSAWSVDKTEQQSRRYSTYVVSFYLKLTSKTYEESTASWGYSIRHKMIEHEYIFLSYSTDHNCPITQRKICLYVWMCQKCFIIFQIVWGLPREKD